MTRRAWELAVVRVFVRDWEAAVRFYRDTLGMPPLRIEPRFGWAEFDTGGCSLAVERLAEDDEEARELVGRYVGVSLRVADIEATHRELRERGVEFLAPAGRQPWGGVLAHLRDPEGNVLTLLGGTPDAGSDAG